MQGRFSRKAQSWPNQRRALAGGNETGACAGNIQAGAFCRDCCWPARRAGSSQPALQRWFGPLLALALAALAGGSLAWAQEKADKPAGPSLYKRLGGYDEIASIVDGFLARMAKEPSFARFGTGRSLASKQRARQLIVDQICALSGGPCFYIGRDMQNAHQGLGITEQEWEASGKMMGEVLEKHKIPPKEQEELGAIIESLRKDIVDKLAEKPKS